MFADRVPGFTCPVRASTVPLRRKSASWRGGFPLSEHDGPHGPKIVALRVFGVGDP